MATIELDNSQLRLIQKALDFYSRIGVLQFEEILTHPSISNILYDMVTPNKKIEIGDNTMRGVVVEIEKDYIKTKGSWGNGDEIKTWYDIENIKLSPDWNNLNIKKDEINIHINKLKNLISGIDITNGNLGIHNSKVDNSCRDAYDMLKIIRHEFWKENQDKSHMTVDSSCILIDQKNEIIVKLDTEKDIRKRKLNNIKNVKNY
jgi:hypothetical protein